MSEPHADRLRQNSIGLPHVLFQSVTHMAPAVSLTFVFLVAIQFSGPVLPLALLIALLAMLCVGSTIGQLAREMPSAGGLYLAPIGVQPRDDLIGERSLVGGNGDVVLDRGDHTGALPGRRLRPRD